MKKHLGLFLLLALSLCSVHCGYSTNILAASGVRTIHVEPFINNINYTSELQSGQEVYIPLLEVKVRDAVINRYLFDGNLKIAQPDTADVILKGALVGYERNVLRRTDNDDVEEYRIHILVDLVLWDPEKEEVVWEERAFAGESTFFLTGPKAKSEAAAADDAIKDLARRIVERTVEAW